MLRLVLSFCFLLLALESGAAVNKLFAYGKSDYTIVVSSQASALEREAASELQDYMQQIGGARLAIATRPSKPGKSIFVGFGTEAQKAGAEAVKEPDAYHYFSHNGNLFILGGGDRGTIYGVSAFLEDVFHVHWLTKECTVVPKLKTYALESIDTYSKPAFKYRYDQFFYGAGTDPAWAAHNKLNMVWDQLPSQYGTLEKYWQAHTSFLLVPPSIYFKQHPEYFALRNGKRVANGQLCLSNPDVQNLVVKQLLKVIAENPGYWCYDVSQNDNQLYCECAKCREIEKKYNAHSGIWIWFINQVADAVAKKYPQKYVGTFAYQYTQKPPTNIKPYDNVVIRLCSIGCCFTHPISSCSHNAAFYTDLCQWSALTKNLFIWDYVVNFANYLIPWPNVQVLGPNLRAFAANGAMAIAEEGQYQGHGGEFSEMKAWVLSKLMWNPYQSTDSLVEVFVKGYYGKAATDIMSYYHLCQGLVTPETHLDIHTEANNYIYSDAFLVQGKRILADALRHSDNATIKKRVEDVQMQTLFLDVTRNKAAALINGEYTKLMNRLQAEKPQINESETATQYIKRISSI